MRRHASLNSPELIGGNANGPISAAGTDPLNEREFSFVPGGTLFHLLSRAHLVGHAMDLVIRRIVLFTVIMWLPLLLLSALDGHLLKGIAVPFLPDVETHIRFLVVVPLLLGAELIVHQRLLPIAWTFLKRGLIPQDAIPTFNMAIDSALRLRNAAWADALLMALVYVVGIFVVWRHFTVVEAATWYAVTSDSDLKLFHAGIWYAAVSLPLFQFLLLRWYFRMFIWIRFLWQVSRIRLALVPTHPDRVGGLGFLAETAYAFSLLVMAHGALLAAQIAERIFFVGAALIDFKFEIAAMVAFLMCLVFGPLLMFSPQLALARRRGILEYGNLAERYVRDFDGKWLGGGAPGGKPLLGSPDIQSLADMGNSFAVVRSMQLAPITRDAILQLAASVLVPLAPLVLTVMSLDQLARTLYGLVF